MKRSALISAALILAASAVSGCDDGTGRADTHFQRGAELASAGEAERAAIEFRNALQADPDHVPTLKAFASLLRAEGDLPNALRTYGRLIELEEEDVEIHVALSEIALALQDFPTVEEHALRAYELDPERPAVRAMAATVRFRQGDTEEALELAESVLAVETDSVPAHMTLIAERMAEGDLEGALSRIDLALAEVPDAEDLHLARLVALEQLGRTEDVKGQLLRMAEHFPENDGIREALLQLHVQEGDYDAAIAILREQAAETPDEPEGKLRVVQLVLETRGSGDARAELERLIAEASDDRPFVGALAQLNFAEGRRDEAIASLRELVAADEDDPANDDLRMLLARMLEAVGDRDGAHALVDGVLARNDRHVGALKMRGERYIREDQTERALTDLRTAGVEAPRDPEVLTLMAMAHEREGASELVGERLARAVEASGLGIQESLRYARFLMREERYGQAEGVLLDGLRRQPENLDLLAALAEVHLLRGDWTRTRQTVGVIRGIETARAEEMAIALELALLQARGETDQAFAFLEGLAGDEARGLQVRLGIAQARLAQGELDAAREEIDAILVQDPTNIPARALQAGIWAASGRFDEAEAAYRSLMADAPELSGPYAYLSGLLYGLDRPDEGAAVLEDGLAATDRDGFLLNIAAGRAYLAQDIDRAIALYEELYERDTSNVVVANNIASLISTHRAEPEAIERAFRIARRLRGTDVPHFQDTYGWLLVLRGDSEQALRYLEPAAAALGDYGLVHYHLGVALYELERWEDAEPRLVRALELMNEGESLPQAADAEQRLASLQEKLSAGDESAGQAGPGN